MDSLYKWLLLFIGIISIISLGYNLSNSSFISKYDEIRKEVASINSSVLSNSREVKLVNQTVEATRGSLQTSYNTLSSKVDSLQALLSVSGKKSSDSEKIIKDLKDEIASLKASIDTYSKDRKTLTEVEKKDILDRLLKLETSTSYTPYNPYTPSVGEYPISYFNESNGFFYGGRLDIGREVVQGGQTFTLPSAIDYRIAKVKLFLMRVGTPTLTMALRKVHPTTGLPTGEPLFTNSMATWDFPSTFGWYQIPIGAVVNGGSRISLSIKVDSNQQNFISWGLLSGDRYPGGRCVTSIDISDRWIMRDNLDLGFEIIGSTY